MFTKERQYATKPHTNINEKKKKEEEEQIGREIRAFRAFFAGRALNGIARGIASGRRE